MNVVDKDIELLYSKYAELFVLRLNQAMTYRRLNQSELGASVGLSASAISKYSNGITYPSNIHEKLFAHSLKLDPRVFYDENVTLEVALDMNNVQTLSEIEKMKRDIEKLKSIVNPDNDSIKKKIKDIIDTISEEDAKIIYPVILKFIGK